MREQMAAIKGKWSWKKPPARIHHAWWLLFLPVYGLVYSLAERTVTSVYWVSYVPLDDQIPFLAPFVFFYVLWYPYQIAMALWLLRRDAPAFRRYIWAAMIGLVTTALIWFVFPNGQDLRPAVVPGSGIDAALIRAIYAVDTNTNVLPSGHVVGTMMVLFAAFDAKTVNRPWRAVVTILAVLINLSTVFIKQHSVLDIAAGLVVSAAVYMVVYVGIRRYQARRGMEARP